MARSAITPLGVTVREEKACHVFLKTGDKVAAYRAAYSVNSKRTSQRIAEDARKVFSRPRVIERLRTLQNEVAEIAKYDIAEAMRESKKAFDVADQDRNPMAMVKAVELRAKIGGLIVERRDNTNRNVKELTDEELEERLREAAAEAGLVIKRAAS